MSTKEKKTEKQATVDDSLELQTEETVSSKLEIELRSTVDRLQRLQAEFENYKKRVLRDTAAYERRVSDRLLLDILPLYDNLQRAFRSYSSNQDVETFVSGIEQIFAQFQQVLEGKGITLIDTENQPFDPTLHEAMLSVPSAIDKNMIVEEFMPGYLRDEQVLRPSKVSVSQGPISEEESE